MVRIKYDRREVARLRRVRGLSMQALAKSTGLTERTIAYVERGYSDPRASTLAKLAQAFGVSVDTFFKERP